MGQINLAIKSVTDNAFSVNKDSELKEKAIVHLIGVFREGLAGTFKRWREINRI